MKAMKSQAKQLDKRSLNILHERNNPGNDGNKPPKKEGQQLKEQMIKKEKGKAQKNPVIPFHLVRQHYESQY